jgi:hypothetical protein
MTEVVAKVLSIRRMFRFCMVILIQAIEYFIGSSPSLGGLAWGFSKRMQNE